MSTVLVLSDADVRELLDMESCIAAMEDVLGALARDELTMPLRFVVRSPGEQLMGLMPAHRAGDEPLFSLKEIVIAPANGARGLDPHQGAVLLHVPELTAIVVGPNNVDQLAPVREALDVRLSEQDRERIGALFA